MNHEINLKTIPKYILNTITEKGIKRKKHLEEIFTDWENIIYIDGTNELEPPFNCTFGVLKLLYTALKNELFEPFILLEDDVSFYAEKKDNILVPEDADAIYLGLSRCGAQYNIDEHMERIYHIPESSNEFDGSRIYNMLSAHAIVILKKEWAFLMLRACLDSISNKRPYDVYLARCQQFFNVYGLRIPIFYQDGNFEGSQHATYITLDNISKATENEILEWKKKTIIPNICKNFIQICGKNKNFSIIYLKQV